ncbi:hypothetical protein [Cytophaga aurantiaca]|uniref:hypothetical protein n=1 Tax=Cytophaga aurantiaca TaxID=29530 RepID=UPI0003749FEF|nr:hypothetical protein [Cytophaga aurantiaca]
MLLSLFYSVLFFLQAVLTPGSNKVDGKHVKIIHAKIKRITFIDTTICESSALVKPDLDFDIYYSLNDSGSRPEVFAFNEKGELLDTKTIPNATNKDWEELVYYKDSLENPHLVIGDMGNNRNKRKDLCLYNYDIDNNTTNKHSFSYEDQSKFPPSEDSLSFDCEAFFRRDSSYYFISKNRSRVPVKLYQLSQDTSAHTANVVQQLSFKGMVTGCSVYKDASGKEKIAVLLYGRIFLFHITDSHAGIQFVPYGVIKFPSGGQSEGISWYNEHELRVTNERGKLFKIIL